MSRAFVKEDNDSGGEDLPERLVSPHPNLVTSEGLKAIEAEVARLDKAYASAQAEADRAALAATARDLRYWSERLATAELTLAPDSANEVRFGSRVTFGRADGRRQVYRIVGEDEADPTKGTLSYVSPLARALIGKAAGDTVASPAGDIEIIEVE